MLENASMEAAPDANSPPLVDPTEDVCRLCFSAKFPVFRASGRNTQIDETTGMIRLEEIAWKDLAESGFSLQRRSLYSLADAQAEAQRRNTDKSGKRGEDVGYRLDGVLIAQVASINAIVDPAGGQVFRVLATPKDGAPAHAEVRIGPAYARHEFLRHRDDLRRVLGQLRAPAALDMPQD